ncbi:helix-turn-helix transcriptional regulator [Microlunatus speluncae]|uniref:helix-turn-helix transcriptional regulator n=1 Tax=Microlunatus speluncae TaxID=2594267 RepID=UPI0012664F5C|nr:LuxR C-terminal-related transcriptional regulator [Microlunatus speluncae]
MGTRALLERGAWNIAHAGHDLDTTFQRLDELLRPHVPYAIASWSTHDPATALFTSCTMTGIEKNPEGEAALFRCEFTAGEPASYRSLIGRRHPAAILSEVTGGDLDLASRYRTIFRPVGFTDELRAVLWSGDTAWGSATLLRFYGRFSAEDVETVGLIARHAADGIRLALLRGAAARPEAVAEPPGIFAVDPTGRVTAVTSPAEHWLELGRAELITAVTAAAAAIRAQPDWAGASSRLLLGDHAVLAIHAAAMSRDSDTVAVIVERARPAEVSAMIVDAYGLTRRQRDVLGQLLLGRSMTQLAHALGISEHTAQDHRKAIYRRTGVGSRSELAGRLQFEQYDPRVWSDVPPSPYGGFLE